MSGYEGFPTEYVRSMKIPGLPEKGTRVLFDAEEEGLRQPEFSAPEISIVFFQKHGRSYLSRKLKVMETPLMGTDLYFTPLWDSERGNKTGQKWTLGEIERMIIHFYRTRTIDYTQYIISRQIVAWVARGYGIYHG